MLFAEAEMLIRIGYIRRQIELILLGGPIGKKLPQNLKTGRRAYSSQVCWLQG